MLVVCSGFLATEVGYEPWAWCGGRKIELDFS